MIKKTKTAKAKKGSRKTPRTHNPEWADHTRKARNDKKIEQWQAAAERDGFEGWSAALTAWKNGEAVLVRVAK